MYVVGSQVIATAAAPDALDRIGWRDGASICDSQAQVLYYQRTPKGRVVFGRGSGEIAFGANIHAGFNRSPQHGAGNIRELQRVYPTLRDVPVEYDWSGPIDCVPEHIPVFDHLRGHPNIFFGMGFKRHRNRPDADRRPHPGEPGAGAEGSLECKRAGRSRASLDPAARTGALPWRQAGAHGDPPPQRGRDPQRETGFPGPHDLGLETRPEEADLERRTIK